MSYYWGTRRAGRRADHSDLVDFARRGMPIIDTVARRARALPAVPTLVRADEDEGKQLSPWAQARARERARVRTRMHDPATLSPRSTTAAGREGWALELSWWRARWLRP
ncbi:MAG: hypothetical protein ACRDXB_05000, partial [Actinomycetes bacterium]